MNLAMREGRREVSGKQETIADIIAEMRSGLLSATVECESCGNKQEQRFTFNGLADRLEAAWKREKAEAEANALAVGGMVEASWKRVLSKTRENDNSGAVVLTDDNNDDRAKSREALEAARDLLLPQCNGGTAFAKACGETVNKTMNALAEPPRNCDRFDSFPQAYDEWYKTEVLPRVDGVVGGVESPFDCWLFLPAVEKKGENNANK